LPDGFQDGFTGGGADTKGRPKVTPAAPRGPAVPVRVCGPAVYLAGVPGVTWRGPRGDRRGGPARSPADDRRRGARDRGALAGVEGHGDGADHASGPGAALPCPSGGAVLPLAWPASWAAAMARATPADPPRPCRSWGKSSPRREECRRQRRPGKSRRFLPT
jgi:hypothetical protein